MPVIVVAQPATEGPAALVVGAIQPRIGPFIEQGLVEPLHLAVDLWPVAARSRAPDPEPSGRLGEGDRLGTGLGIVGQNLLDPDPVLAKNAAAPARKRAAVVACSSARSRPLAPSP